MKRPLIFTAAFLAAGIAHAVDVKEVAVGRVGSRQSVSVSTSTWTDMITTRTVNKRSGIKVNNPTANNADLNCTADTAEPTITIGTGEIEIKDGDNPFFELDNNLKLYCVSLHTAAETIYSKEIGQ